MIEETPLVSIIIPVFNREMLLTETLNSIREQTYKNWECILVDDGSTDGSVTRMQAFEKSDKRFKLFKRPENRLKGANSCRNYGFEISKGEFVNWFDSDDVMHSQFLSEKVAAFKDGIDCVISKTLFFKETILNITGREKRTKLSSNLIEDFIILDISWYLPDPMWKRSFLENKKLFDEFLLKGQDRDFHIKRLLESPKIKIIDSFLTYYRQHSNTTSYVFKKEVMLSYFNSISERIQLLFPLGISNKVRFFLLKQQVKNYPHLYKEKGSFKRFLSVFKKLFVLDLQNVIWFLKFITAAIFLNLTGKGSFILKG